MADASPPPTPTSGTAAERWAAVLQAQALLQTHFPECVLVGGTAAALHAGHRHSLDGDHVLTDLRSRFPAMLQRLERLAGWKTRRVLAPVEVLGRFQGVPTGIRQLRRHEPLETETIAGIRVPSLAEMLRIKGWLIVSRNATRDYLDFCALAQRTGSALDLALRPLDGLYPQASGESVTRQLARQLAEPQPWDLQGIDLRRYRGIAPPWDDWDHVTAQCRAVAQRVLQEILGTAEGRDAP